MNRYDEPELGAQALEEVEHLRLDQHVERRDRLVADDQRRVERQRARDRHALGLPARELARAPAAVASGSSPTRSSTSWTRSPALGAACRRRRRPAAPRRAAATRHFGSSEPNGSWKTICMWRRASQQRACRFRPDELDSRADGPSRTSAAAPAAASARASTCPTRSRRRCPSVSPGGRRTTRPTRRARRRPSTPPRPRTVNSCTRLRDLAAAARAFVAVRSSLDGLGLAPARTDASTPTGARAPALRAAARLLGSLSRTSGQRGANGQPARAVGEVRRLARHDRQRGVRRLSSARDRVRAAPACRASARGANSFARRRRARPPRPAYMTSTSSAKLAARPRSWLIMINAMPRRCCRSRSSSMIWACVVTSSAVVASSAISSCGSPASAIAIITRWRMPPES